MKLKLFTPVLCLLAFSVHASALELFVGPNGSDTNEGTRVKPLASLEAARDQLRANGGSPKILNLLKGNYERTNSFMLDQRDNGLTVRGEVGAQLIGGTKLLGWQKTDDSRLPESARGQVSSLKLNQKLDILRRHGFGINPSPAPPELFFEGLPQTLARWPNGDDWSNLASGAEGKFTVKVPSPKLASWSKAEDLWVHGYWTYDWADSSERVSAIDPSSQSISTAAPHGVYGYKAGSRFYAYNLIEELDSPGEYWIDRKTQTIYAWLPAAGETILSTLDVPLIEVRNGSNLLLEKLTLSCSRDQGIVIKDGDQVTVAGCTIHGLGTTGISVEGGSNHRVVSCDLYDLGESGISLTGGDRKTLVPGGHVVENCDIHHYSRLCRTYRPAIGINGVGNHALNNRLHDAPHNAILMGGNDHEIAGNEIFRVCTQTGDAGAIYMGRNFTMRGTVIRNNYFHEIGPTVTRKDGFVDVMAVYLDDCYCGTSIVGNIFSHAGRATMIGGGRDNLIANNLFLDCNPAIHVDARGTGWAKSWFDGRDPFIMNGLKEVPYDRSPYTNRYPHLANILEDEPAKAKYNQITNNVIIGKMKPIDWLDGLGEKTVMTQGNTLVREAREVSLQESDYAVKVPGFPKIEFAKIGLHTDQYRTQTTLARAVGK